MKKSIQTLLFLAASLVAVSVESQAQKQYEMNVVRNDGTKRTFTVSEIKEINFVEVTPETPETGNYEAVDLGLTVRWCSKNVGAKEVYERGSYFASGEVKTKKEFTWGTYKWTEDGTEYAISKYNSVDKKRDIDLEDDAARVNMGGEWRMPTSEEISELREKCSWRWIKTSETVDGVFYIGPGYLVSGNGNSIFLPVTGYYEGTEFKGYATPLRVGFYWGSTIELAWGFSKRSIMVDPEMGILIYPISRIFGAPVRAVCPRLKK